MTPILWLLGILAPLWFMIGLHELGWNPQIQQIGDYCTGKTLALLFGLGGIWFITTMFDRKTEGDWFATIAKDRISVRYVTVAVIIAAGLIVAWS